MTKRPTNVATWNVRTLNGPTKIDELVSATGALKLDIVVVTETYLLNNFETTNKGYTFYNSGKSIEEETV